MKLMGFLLVLLTVLACYEVAAIPLSCDEIKAKLKPGDVLFMGLNNQLFEQVAKATMTWVAHTAYVLQDDAGRWIVYESKVPLSTRTELCAFVARGVPGEIAAARWPGLVPHDLDVLKIEGEKRMGKGYQQGFDYDSNLQFCSKFVHDIFAQIKGSPEIGRIETFGDVMAKAERELSPADYEDTKKFFERWFNGPIPVQRRTVTPAALYNDADLQLIFDRQDGVSI